MPGEASTQAGVESGYRPPLVSVLIVTWNGWSFLEQALRSVLREVASGVGCEVLVVDNGSTDETLALIPLRFPTIRLIEMGENAGFARANNVGAREAVGEWLLLLNNDAALEEGSLAHLLEAAKAHPQFDVVVPQMVTAADPQVVDNRGIMLDWTGHFRQIDSGRRAADGPSLAEVFGGSGGALLIRRRLLRSLPLFDEALGTYLEDADFAARSREAGARALYVADGRIRHVGSASAGRQPERKVFFILRNMLVLRRRWFPWRHYWWLVPTAMVYELYQIGRHIAQGMPGVVRSAWNAAPAVEQSLLPRQRGNHARIGAWLGVRRRAFAEGSEGHAPSG